MKIKRYHNLISLILIILWSGSSYAQNNFTLLNTIEGDSGIFGSATGIGDFDENGLGDLVYLLDKFTINNSVVRTQAYLMFSTNKTPASEFYTAYTSDEGSELSDSEDGFGTIIKTGDFNGDTHSDLIITSPYTKIKDGKENIGCIRIYYGNGEEPLYTGKTILCGAEADEYFGKNIAIGDLDNDGRDDLAVYSAFTVNVDNIIRTKGKVSIFYGRESGILETPDVVLTAPDLAFEFGKALLIYKLHVGDVPVLVVGAPRDETVSINGGKVFIYPGLQSQKTLSNVPQYTITGEQFQCLGMTLAAGDLYASQGPELVIGAGNDYERGGCGSTDQILIYTGVGKAVSTAPAYTLDGYLPAVSQLHSTGYDDLVFIKDSKINVHFGKSKGIMTTPDTVLAQENVSAFTLGDLTGDGQDDFVVSYSENYGNIGIYGYDECPDDPDKLSAGSCGCGNPDTDSNDNNIADCLPTAEMEYYIADVQKKLRRIKTSSSAKKIKTIKKSLRKMVQLVRNEDIQVVAGTAVNVEKKILAAVRATKKALKVSLSSFAKNKKKAIKKLKVAKNLLGEDSL